MMRHAAAYAAKTRTGTPYRRHRIRTSQCNYIGDAISDVRRLGWRMNRRLLLAASAIALASPDLVRSWLGRSIAFGPLTSAFTILVVAIVAMDRAGDTPPPIDRSSRP